MFGWLKRTAALLAGMVMLLFLAWTAGKRDQRQSAAVDEAAAYKKTRREMDDVENNISDDPAVLRDWLHSRGKQ
jgi:Mg2+/citrate symporter